MGLRMRMIGAVLHNRVFDMLVLYNVMVYALAVAMYHLIDFDTHFEWTDKAPISSQKIMYYAFLSHSGVMCAECTPRTELGRSLLAVHVLFSWGIIIALLAPWSPPG